MFLKHMSRHMWHAPVPQARSASRGSGAHQEHPPVSTHRHDSQWQTGCLKLKVKPVKTTLTVLLYAFEMLFKTETSEVKADNTIIISRVKQSDSSNNTQKINIPFQTLYSDVTSHACDVLVTTRRGQVFVVTTSSQSRTL